MSTPSPTRGPARETRLLLLTLGVSVAVLFLLARFRFPERPISELATPQPLARLARTTTFDDLSATLADLLRRAADARITLRVSADAQTGASRLAQALRVRDDLALAVLPIDAHIDAIDNQPAAGNPIVARDEVRGLVLVRVPPRATPSLPVQPQADSLDLPGFLAVIDAAPGGPSVRAEFVSNLTPHPHPAWDASIIALGGISTARPGAMVFTLDGRFVGMVLPDDDETIVAPAEALLARADRLTRGESVLAPNAGLAVQPLSPSLAKATKAPNGVVIAAIEGAVVPTSAALRIGDVIAAIDNDAIRSVTDWERLLSRRAPGTTVQLHVVRRDGAVEVPLTLTWRDALLAPGDDGTVAAAAASGAARVTAAAAAKRSGHAAGAAKRTESAAGTLGLSLRELPNAGGLEVLRVAPASPAARAGLHVGDRLTVLPDASPAPTAAPADIRAATAARAPTSSPRSTASAARASASAATSAPLTMARVEAAFKTLSSGDALLLGINRAGQPFVVAVEKP
jgi:S1-C subfamily serine protease